MRTNMLCFIVEELRKNFRRKMRLSYNRIGQIKRTIKSSDFYVIVENPTFRSSGQQAQLRKVNVESKIPHGPTCPP